MEGERRCWSTEEKERGCRRPLPSANNDIEERDQREKEENKAGGSSYIFMRWRRL